MIRPPRLRTASLSDDEASGAEQPVKKPPVAKKPAPDKKPAAAKKPGAAKKPAAVQKPAATTPAAAKKPAAKKPSATTPSVTTPPAAKPAAAKPAATRKPAAAKLVPAGTPAAAAEPEVATEPTPPTPPARSSSRTRLAIALVAGGAVLVVIAVMTVIALVLPGILRGGAPSSATDVIDIPAKPKPTWSFDWVGGADADFLEDYPEIAPVGESHALVWSSFDYYAFTDSQGDSDGWYEGYDEQYDQGYAAGLEYEIAYQRWFDDTTFSLPFPRDEDYYPEGAYGNFEQWLGFDDGFWDARLGEPAGLSRKQEPVDPDYTPTIALLDTRSGDADWTVDLAEAIEGVDYSSSFYALDVPGSDAVVVSSSTTVGDEVAYVVAALDRADGGILSQLESDGPVSVAAFDGDLIVTTTEADGDDTEVARYAVGGLDDDPLWRQRGPESSFGATVYELGADYLRVIGDDQGVILRGDTGDEADFGDDIDYSVDYAFAGDQLVRTERFDDSTRLEGWRANGDTAWDDAVEADYARVVDSTIFTAEADGDHYAGLNVIDPATGAARWQDAWDDDFDSVYGVRDGAVLVISGTRLVVLDAGSGEARFSQKLGDVSAFYEGDDAYYVNTGDALTAYGYDKRGARWSLGIDEDHAVIAIGRSLGLIDIPTGTLRGLSAR